MHPTTERGNMITVDNVSKIVIGDFCKKTFWKNDRNADISQGYVLQKVIDNFHRAVKGYRDGVLLVPINPSKFTCPVVQLKGGEYLFGKFESRIPTEDPRKKISVLGGTPLPALSVDVVLYSTKVLAEDGEDYDHSADYEVVTILAKPCIGEQPMPPETLMANHFKISGGTATNMNPEEFEKALKESFLFWKDKALLY